jgi:DNA-binding transcriptional ArsR family regulator
VTPSSSRAKSKHVSDLPAAHVAHVQHSPASRVLPPGAVLPPLVTGDTGKGVQTPPADRKPGRTHARRRQRHYGRFAVLNGFVDGSMGTLPRAAALVWVCLWRDTKPDGLARTAVTDLARRVGGDRRTVLRALRLLTDRGLLEVVRRGGLGRGVSAYRVKVG